MIIKRLKYKGVTYNYVKTYLIIEGKLSDNVCKNIKVCYTKKEATNEIKKLKKENPKKNYWVKKHLKPILTIKEAK